MTATATTATDYSKYNTNKLRYILNSTRKQIAKFEDAIIKADKQISEFTKKREEYLQKEALIRKELNLKLPIPNKETRNLLESDEVDRVYSSHKEFMESLENDD